jgi:hypothetical protein
MLTRLLTDFRRQILTQSISAGFRAFFESTSLAGLASE